MGNSNSSPINETLSLDSWNLSHLPTLQEFLGTRSSHLYSSFPKQIPEENIFSNLDLRHFSCPEGETLSSFLNEVHKHMQVEFVKENWTDNAFPSNSGNFKILAQELKGVELTEEELGKIRQMFGLPLQVEVEEEEESSVTNTSPEDNASVEGDTSVEKERDAKMVKKEKLLDITQVYRGYSVYEFPDNSLGMPLNNKKVGLESCFVGSLDNKLVVVAPSEEPKLTRQIRFDWHVVQVGEDQVKLVLEDARGVLVDAESGKVVEEVEDIHFDNLVKAHQSFEDSNSREMALHGRRYLSWVKKVQNEGEIRALAGGEIEGEIVSLGDFFDKMKLE